MGFSAQEGRSDYSGGSMDVISQNELAVEEGRAYTQSRYISSLTNGSSALILIENKSARDILATDILIATTGEGLFEVLKNVTVSSEGTQLTPTNRKTGEPDDKTIEVSYGASYSGGESLGKDVIPANSPLNITGNTPSSNYVVSSKTNLLISLTNKSGKNNNFSVRVSYIHQRS